MTLEDQTLNMGSIQNEDQQTIVKLLPNNVNHNNIQKNSPTPPLLFSKRLLVVIMLFICYVNFQSLKHNINITIVEMTTNMSESCPRATRNASTGPEFDWDSRTSGLVNSVISYGGSFAFLVGFLIYKFGGSASCAFCMILSGITTVLHPPALDKNFHLFLACRILTGFVESGFYISTSEISAKWFPKKERTTLLSLAFNGTNVGLAVSYPFCGYLACKWGWRMVFYVTGTMSIISGVILKLIVPNLPSQDRCISKKELAYILEETTDSYSKKLNSIDNTKPKKNNDVLKCVLTSAPVWALFVMQFCFIWLGTVLSACLPAYIQDLTQKSVDKIGYITMIPNVVYIFMFPIAGILIDYWKNHTKTTLTRIHQIILSLAFLSASILSIATVLISQFTISLVLFVFIQVFLSPVPLVLSIIMINLAPQYAGCIASGSSIFFSLGTIAPQSLVGFVVTNHYVQEWNNIFLMTACVSIVGALIFVICGSSERQKWAL